MRVVIVGGGVVGCSAALALAKDGHEVVVLERGEPGGEASGAAAGILGAQLETHEDSSFARFCVASRERFASWVQELVAATGIDVGYRPSGVLRVALDAGELATLKAQTAWQTKAGLALEHLDDGAARAIEPALGPMAGAIWFPDDARIDPPSLVQAVRVAATRAGAQFRVGTIARGVIQREGRVRGVTLQDGEIVEASAVVIAAGSWSSLLEGSALAPDAVRPARGQIVELFVGAPLFRTVIDGASAYLSPRDDGRVLVGSTMELVGFQRGVTAGAVGRLLTEAVRLVPALENASIRRTWSGLRPRADDELPRLGPTPVDGLVVATAHFRNGILLAPLTAEIVRALVRGEPSPFPIDGFEPTRAIVASP